MWPNPFSPLDVFISHGFAPESNRPLSDRSSTPTWGFLQAGSALAWASGTDGVPRGTRSGMDEAVRCAPRGPGPGRSTPRRLRPHPQPRPAPPAARPASRLRERPGFVSGRGGGAPAAALKFLEPQPRPQRLPRDSTFAITVKYLDSLFLPFYLLQLIRVLLPFSV